MQRELGKDIEPGKKRIAFLMDNCDAVEEKGYMKRFTLEQLSQMKETLSETDIKINDIEDEKKEVMSEFKERLDPLVKERKTILVGLKNKAEFVSENCYKFVDTENREVSFYNQEGDLIESRPAFPEEMQGSIFQLNRKTGTND